MTIDVQWLSRRCVENAGVVVECCRNAGACSDAGSEKEMVRLRSDGAVERSL